VFYSLHSLLVLNMADASSFQRYHFFKLGPNCDSFCINMVLKGMGLETGFKWLGVKYTCGLVCTR
jgi:hypothetical protein